MELVQLISQTGDGDMAASFNKERFFKKNGIKPPDIIEAGLVHGRKVKRTGEKETGKKMEGVDGIFTFSNNLFLTITVADCLPLFLASSRMVGILHAGWRGLEQGIIEEAMAKISASGEKPEEIKVTIGPGIGGCHFEVGDDVRQKFSTFAHCFYREGKYLDLKRVAVEILKEQGVQDIEVSPICTFCDDKYFSYRQGRPRGRMIALIGRRVK